MARCDVAAGERAQATRQKSTVRADVNLASAPGKIYRRNRKNLPHSSHANKLVSTSYLSKHLTKSLSATSGGNDFFTGEDRLIVTERRTRETPSRFSKHAYAHGYTAGPVPTRAGGHKTSKIQANQ